jgi:Transmembrane secretion effector
VSTHIWFLANGAAMTVLSLLALRSLGFTAYTFGLLLAVFGITSLIGASIAPWSGTWLGSGRMIFLARVAYPTVWLIVAIASSTMIGDALLFRCAVPPGPRRRHGELKRDGLLAGTHAARTPRPGERRETLGQSSDARTRNSHCGRRRRADR